MDSGQLTVVSGQWAVGSGQLAVGSGQLAVGSWQLAVGSWQFADCSSVARNPVSTSFADRNEKYSKKPGF